VVRCAFKPSWDTSGAFRLVRTEAANEMESPRVVQRARTMTIPRAQEMGLLTETQRANQTDGDAEGDSEAPHPHKAI
jgi:hypothetical protein